jgi:hypothetical protein
MYDNEWVNFPRGSWDWTNEGRAGWDIDWVNGIRCSIISVYVDAVLGPVGPVGPVDRTVGTVGPVATVETVGIVDARVNRLVEPEPAIGLSTIAGADPLDTTAVSDSDGGGRDVAVDEVRNFNNLASFNSISLCGENKR